jgi:zeaxanthin epoxidase
LPVPVCGLTRQSTVGMPHMKVTILEQTSEFKRFGGPIQLASNALQLLKEMDEPCYNQIVEKLPLPATRKNGIKMVFARNGQV